VNGKCGKRNAGAARHLQTNIPVPALLQDWRAEGTTRLLLYFCNRCTTMRTALQESKPANKVPVFKKRDKRGKWFRKSLLTVVY